MTTFNFNSKETYLAARAEWKANYKKITYDIRLTRQRFNEAACNFSRTGSYSYARGSDNTAYNTAYKDMEACRAERETLRNEANAELQNLHAMKVEAARQWMEVNNFTVA